MDSLVLKVRVTGVPGAYKVSAQIEGMEGADGADGDLGTLPEDLVEQLGPLQETILNTTLSLPDRPPAGAQPKVGGIAHPVRSLAANFGSGADAKSIRDIGTTLFNCIFQQDIYALYRKTLDSAHKTRTRLSIKLCVEAPELAYIPWETMYDKRGSFHLCCYGATPFARTASMKDQELYIYNETPIRILGMISAPKSFVGTQHELNTAAEESALEQALDPLIKANQVRLCWTADGTYKKLTKRLVKGDNGNPWDVFLFIGHGVEGKIVLEEEDGTGYEFLSADVLKGLLAETMGPKLVILNSCRGAQIERSDRFASTAETLIRGGGIAAVIAMQFDISDKMGTTFSPVLFRQLLGLDLPIQQAMTLTRLELQRRGFTEWISPVLYMQNKDGTVVPPRDALPRTGS
jgi:hypothetical protein